MGRAFITGWGLCTPLGSSAESTYEAVRAGKFTAKHSPAAGVVLADAPSPRVCNLAIQVASESCGHAGWSDDDVRSSETALIIATSKGPVEAWIDPTRAQAIGLHEVAEDVARFVGLTGPRLTLSAACASGLHALARAKMLLEEGFDRVLVVAAESSLHPIFIGSFKRLGVLAAEICRPFDTHRDGFLVSESAAAVCVERLPRGTAPAVEIESAIIAADASHLTSLDPAGVALRRVIRRSLAGRPVDLIHAHGTGTIMNDQIELDAIESLIEPSWEAPILFSHKGALGHSLGAAGLVAVALNCMMHARDEVPGMPTCQNPLECRRVNLSHRCTSQRVQRSLSLAAGFGGTLGAITLKRR